MATKILNRALTGVTNRRTVDNFARLAERIPWRPESPFLIASTLMVPGYVDVHEVGHIAEFIESLNADIPYGLLAFHPEYRMIDLPPTSRQQAQACLEAATKAGLRRVRVGNLHLPGGHGPIERAQASLISSVGQSLIENDQRAHSPLLAAGLVSELRNSQNSLHLGDSLELVAGFLNSNRMGSEIECFHS